MDININKSVLIIGAGQLGSRHLQGVLKVEGHLIVTVLDPSEDSLNVAKTRALEVTHQHKLSFVQTWETLPNEFEIVIVATGANVRPMIVKNLLSKIKVKFLILEKVLFQDLKSYEEIGNLIKEQKVSVWVNHPRRMNEGYQKIKQLIEQDKSQIQFSVAGGDWGLGCNGLHFIDLLSYLSGSEIDAIDTECLDNSVIESKRANHVEFTGTIKGTTNNRSFFTITSFSNILSPITIFIATAKKRWKIEEGVINQISLLEFVNGKAIQKEETVAMEFQSSLTTKLIDSLLESGNCELPTYQQSIASHIPFIKSFLAKYNQLTGLNTSSCPIT